MREMPSREVAASHSRVPQDVADTRADVYGCEHDHEVVYLRRVRTGACREGEERMSDILIGVYVLGAIITAFIAMLLMLFIEPDEDIKDLAAARKGAARTLILIPIWPLVVAYLAVRSAQHVYKSAACREGEER